MAQFCKFFLVGILNTAIDLTVLGILTHMIGVPVSSLQFAACKTVSFLCALANSYFLNKYWVFRKSDQARQGVSEKIRFTAVSMVGLLINTTCASLAFHILSGMRMFAQMQMAVVQASGLVGTFGALMWNFAGYKFIVFKNTNHENIPFSDSASIQGVPKNRVDAQEP